MSSKFTYVCLPTRAPRARRGHMMVYLVVCIPVMLMFCGLAIDLGRFELTGSELQATADGAARYAARGFNSSASPMTTARANAKSIAAASIADGAAPSLVDADIEQGIYNAQTRTFTPNTSGSHIRVTVRQTLNRPGSMPLLLSCFTGNAQKVLSRNAVARCTSTTTTIQPPASGNLWLSGMPDNSEHRNFRNDADWVWDNNGSSGSEKQRPLVMDLEGLGLEAGDTISLEGISGTAAYNNQQLDSTTNSADGNTGYLVANGVAPANSPPTNSANGMSNVRAPIGAVMAVFLTDDAPNISGAPSCLDFGTAAARDYTSISPLVKQVFYIGDGKRANGELQSIKIPAGATRVFMGMMDAWQWNDNVGNFQTRLYSGTTTTLLK